MLIAAGAKVDATGIVSWYCGSYDSAIALIPGKLDWALGRLSMDRYRRRR